MKGLIFDLDGTLLNTIPDIRKALNAVLEDYGFAELTENEVAVYLGNGFRYLVESALPETKKEELLEEALLKFEYYYSLYYLDDTRPYPGIKVLLQQLQKQGYLLAVNSNKKESYAINLLAQFFPEIHFCDVWGMRQGIPGKPNPQAAFAILEKMNLSHEEVLYIGDSETDYATAKNAGLPFIAVTWGFRSPEKLQELGVSQLVYSAQELEKCIQDKK